ncbi:MAG: dethiobiotin synthase, partial [Bacteroidota bacterium]
MAKKLFIAATGQHKGKTTCTLGLCASLKAAGYDVGYCKPVGQKHLTVDGQIADKDAVLFAQLLDFKIDSKIHSPVVIASGVTTQFIDEPEQFDFRQDLEYADEALVKKHEIVVYEGTGHPGVGSIVNFSNPRVAKLLGADVVLVVEGGIGKTIDNMNLSRALFEKHGLELKGVIINKVHPDKIERVQTYVTKRLQEYNIPVLGVIPYDRTLSNPILSTVCMAVRGKVLVNQHKLWNQVEEILAGTFIEVDEFTYLKNVLLITSSRRFHAAMAKIKEGIKERELE